jgi:hypothetical protein
MQPLAAAADFPAEIADPGPGLSEAGYRDTERRESLVA